MTREQHLAVVNAHRSMKGKATPSEYMAYMWSRQALGETLTAGQRGFLASAQKPHWYGEAIAAEAPKAEATPARAFVPPARAAQPTHPDPADVPPWVTEDQQEARA